MDARNGLNATTLPGDRVRLLTARVAGPDECAGTAIVVGTSDTVALTVSWWSADEDIRTLDARTTSFLTCIGMPELTPGTRYEVQVQVGDQFRRFVLDSDGVAAAAGGVGVRGDAGPHRGDRAAPARRVGAGVPERDQRRRAALRRGDSRVRPLRASAGERAGDCGLGGARSGEVRPRVHRAHHVRVRRRGGQDHVPVRDRHQRRWRRGLRGPDDRPDGRPRHAGVPHPAGVGARHPRVDGDRDARRRPGVRRVDPGLRPAGRPGVPVR